MFLPIRSRRCRTSRCITPVARRTAPPTLVRSAAEPAVETAVAEPVAEPVASAEATEEPVTETATKRQSVFGNLGRCASISRKALQI